MIIGTEHIINWISTNQTPYWRLGTKIGSGDDGASSSIMFSSSNKEETIALEDSKNRLKNCLAMMAPGNYVIEAWSTVDQKKGRIKTPFQITNANGSAPVQQGAGINGLGYAQPNISEMIETALQKERDKNKIDRLEADLTAKTARIKELEAQLDSAQIRIGNRFDQVFGSVFGNMKEANPNAAVGTLEEQSERIAQHMEKWANADPGFEVALKGIAELAATDPTKYNMAKNML